MKALGHTSTIDHNIDPQIKKFMWTTSDNLEKIIKAHNSDVINTMLALDHFREWLIIVKDNQIIFWNSFWLNLFWLHVYDKWTGNFEKSILNSTYLEWWSKQRFLDIINEKKETETINIVQTDWSLKEIVLRYTKFPDWSFGIYLKEPIKSGNEWICSLTKLPNDKAELRRSIKKDIARAKRDWSMIWVMFIDLNWFKLINDIYWHTIWDILLKITVDRIRSCFRDTDTITRVWWDEFVIVVNWINHIDDLNMLASKMLKNIEKEINLNWKRLYVGAAIWISIFPKDCHSDLSCENTLINNADAAMYTQKHSDNKNWRTFFNDWMKQQKEKKDMIRKILKEAIKHNLFKLVYQNIEDSNWELIWLETFIRLETDSLSIPTKEFIKEAEESGLINDVWDWIIANSIKELSKLWDDNIKLFINTSARQLQSINLVNTISDTIKETWVSPNNIVIEIKERDLLDNYIVIKETIEELSKLWILFCIDNFWTWQTSINTLWLIKLHSIKIDIDLIQNIWNAHNCKSTLVEAIMVLAKHYNIKIIAEWIETQEILDNLKSLEWKSNIQCDWYQWFYYGKAISMIENSKIRNNTSDTANPQNFDI